MSTTYERLQNLADAIRYKFDGAATDLWGSSSLFDGGTGTNGLLDLSAATGSTLTTRLNAHLTLAKTFGGTGGVGTFTKAQLEALTDYITAVQAELSELDAGLTAGGVNTVHLADDAVTGAKIAANAIDSEHYVDGSIDAEHLASDAVTGAKIAANAIDSEHYVDGSIDRVHLAADIVDGTKIANSAVDTEHLASDAVTGAKIAANAIDSEHYVDGSIDTVHLASDAVTGEKIAANAIDSEHYVDGSIDTVHLASDAVTGEKIAANAIDSEHYVDGSIDAVHLASDAVTSAKMADSSVSGGYQGTIQDYSITQYDLASDSVTQAKLDNQWAYDGSSNLEDMLGDSPLTATVTESIGAQRLHNNFDRDSGADSLTAASIKEAVRSVVDDKHVYDDAAELTSAISRAMGGYGHLADEMYAPIKTELDKVAVRDTNDFAYVQSTIYSHVSAASSSADAIGSAIREGIQTPIHSDDRLTTGFGDQTNDVTQWKSSMEADLDDLGTSASHTDLYNTLVTRLNTIKLNPTGSAATDLASDIQDLVEHNGANADTVAASLADAIAAATTTSSSQSTDFYYLSLAIYNKLNEVSPDITASEISTGFDRTTDAATPWQEALVAALSTATTTTAITDALNNEFSLGLDFGLTAGEVTSIQAGINNFITENGSYNNAADVASKLANDIGSLALISESSGDLSSGSVSSLANAVYGVLASNTVTIDELDDEAVTAHSAGGSSNAGIWRDQILVALDSINGSSTVSDLIDALNTTYNGLTINITGATATQLATDISNAPYDDVEAVAEAMRVKIAAIDIEGGQNLDSEDLVSLSTAIFNTINLTASNIVDGFDSTADRGSVSTWKSEVVSALNGLGTAAAASDITDILNTQYENVEFNLSAQEATDLQSDIDKLVASDTYASVDAVAAALATAINAVSVSTSSNDMSTTMTSNIATAVFNLMNELTPRTTQSDLQGFFDDQSSEYAEWQDQVASAIQSLSGTTESAQIAELYSDLTTARTYTDSEGKDTTVTLSGQGSAEFERDVQMLLTNSPTAYPNVQAVATAMRAYMLGSGAITGTSDSDSSAVSKLVNSIETVLDDYMTDDSDMAAYITDINKYLSDAVEAGLNTVYSMANHYDNLSASDYSSGAELAREIVKTTSFKGGTDAGSYDANLLETQLTNTLNAIYERDGDFAGLVSAAKAAIDSSTGSTSNASEIESAFTDYFVPLTDNDASGDLDGAFTGTSGIADWVSNAQTALGTATTATAVVAALNDATSTGDFNFSIAGTDLQADLTALVTAGAYDDIAAVASALSTAINGLTSESTIRGAIYGVLDDVNTVTSGDFAELITAGVGNQKPVSAVSAIGLGALTTSATNIVGAVNEHDAEIGDMSTLSGFTASTVVSALNELKSEASPYIEEIDTPQRIVLCTNDGTGDGDVAQVIAAIAKDGNNVDTTTALTNVSKCYAWSELLRAGNSLKFHVHGSATDCSAAGAVLPSSQGDALASCLGTILPGSLDTVSIG